MRFAEDVAAGQFHDLVHHTTHRQRIRRIGVADAEDLDVLVLDLPPGTGDIQLTIVQTIALDGAVIVTTPQEIALIDARKAINMFAKVNVRILGLIENMSWFECDHGTRYHLFGDGGGEREAERLKVPLLAQIPIDPETRQRCDEGEPVALLDGSKSSIAAAFEQAAEQLPIIPAHEQS